MNVTEKMREAFYSKAEVLSIGAIRNLDAALTAALAAREDAEPVWWLVSTDVGKVIFHGADKARAERVAAIRKSDIVPLYASPRSSEAVEALKPFAAMANEMSYSKTGPVWGYNGAELTFEDFRRARRIVEGK